MRLRLFILPALLAIGLSPERAAAQESEYPLLRKSGETIDEFVPHGCSLLDTASGDLNGDGFGDVVIVVECGAATDEETDTPEQQYRSINRPRILAVLFGLAGGGFRLSVQANGAILGSDEGGMMGDPWAGIEINRGSFVIRSYGGSSWRWEVSYRFRYQKDDWYLIGATNLSYHVGTGEMEGSDYNLLTGDVEITRGNVFGVECVECDDCTKCEGCDECSECERCTESDDTITRVKVGKKPLRRLEDFRQSTWEVPEDDT